MRAQSGQTTLEYVALIFLATLLLAAGAALLSTAAIAHAVVAQFTRALCLAGRGDCDRDRTPCVLSARTASDEVLLRLAVVRLGGGRTVVRERRSDGRELLTVIGRGGAGIGAEVGGEVAIGSVSVGALAGGSVEARIGRSRSWLVHDARAGDALLRRLTPTVAAVRGGALGRRRPRRPPPPDVTVSEHGLDTTLRGTLGRVGLELDAEDLAGVRVDRTARERTFLIRRRSQAVGSVGLLAGFGGEAAARREERYALTVDAAGRPLDLAITEARRVHAGARLPGPLRTLAGRAALPLRRGRVVQTERHLDLTVPANLAAAAAFVRALRRPRLRLGDAVVVSDALRARLDAAGRAQARVYALEVAHNGARGSLSAGAGLGGGYERTVETLRLTAASIRGADGVWRPREDCRPPAARA